MKRGWIRSLIAAAAVGAAIAPALAASKVGYVKLEGPIAERNTSPVSLFSVDQTVTIRDVIDSFDRIAASSTLDGVVIRLQEAALNAAQIEEIGAAMQRIRDSGKKIHIFTEIYGPGELLVGSYADEVIMQSGGAVSLPGLYMEEMFLADTLRWAGFEPDFIQIGDYKGAKEMFANSEPSPEWDRNINQLLDSLYGAMTDRLCAGRGLSAEQLEKAMEQCFLADGPTAQRLGLIDAEVDRLALDEHLEAAYGENFTWRTDLGPGRKDPTKDIAAMGFFEAFNMMMQMFAGQAAYGPTRDTIAVLHIDGPIMDGESSFGGFLSGPSVGSLTIREVLADLEEDDKIKGVIVRINSPGGSAIASESIWLGLRRLAEVKPVWTSVGSMAASGGYYIAVGGDRIYVNPSSIVGSIGVVSGKLAMGGLYDKLKVNVVARARGPRASIMSAVSPWSETERALMRQKMQEIYDLFTRRVTAGRDGIDLSKTAEGRLFAGDKAVGLKMADKMGGIEVAVADMAGELGLADGSFDVIDYPPPPTFEEMLENMMGGMVRAPGASSETAALAAVAREVLGPTAWPQVRDAITNLLQFQKEPVMLVSPRVLIFR